VGGHEPPERQSEIDDVTSLELGSQEPWQTNAVTESIRHILDDADRSAESISGWSSFIDKDASGE
jgi:hypothetical protein